MTITDRFIMKRFCAFAILFFVSIATPAQSRKAKVGIVIKRIEVCEKTFLSSDELSDPEIISFLGLVRRNSIYPYWTFSSVSTQKITALDNSIIGNFTSTAINVSINNKGQEMSIVVTNKTQGWFAIDISSIHYNIAFLMDGEKIEYPATDFSYTLGTLFNYYRGEYNWVLLPPFTSTEFSYFRVDGYMHGFDIISSCIKNNSQLYFDLPIYIFSSDPFTRVKSEMKAKSMYSYSPRTPVEKWLPYRGGYFMDGNAIYIHENYESFFSTYEKALILKFVCGVEVSDTTLPTKKNEYGLDIYTR